MCQLMIRCNHPGLFNCITSARSTALTQSDVNYVSSEKKTTPHEGSARTTGRGSKRD